MEKESLKIKPSLRKDKRSINVLLYTFDLPTLIKIIKHKHTLAKEGLNAMILLKNQHKQIVLTMLHEIQELNLFRQMNQFPFK